jgi:hypothetical protein
MNEFKQKFINQKVIEVSGAKHVKFWHYLVNFLLLYTVYLVSFRDILSQAISFFISLFIFMILIPLAIGLDEQVILMAGLLCSAIYVILLFIVDKIIKFVFPIKLN